MNKSIGEIFLGVAVVLVGVGFLLGALNVLDFGSVLSTWWPMVIVAVGVASFISNPRVFVWPLLIVAFGVLLQLKQLGIVAFSAWSLVWPTIVIIVGLHLLFGRGKAAKEVDANKLDIIALFSGNQTKSTASKLSGGQATAIFGGVELDLTEAKLAGGASLDVFTAFGGIDIKVPEGWRVNVNGIPLFGGWENKAKIPKDDKAPTLNIRGTCLFGGVSVKNG